MKSFIETLLKFVAKHDIHYDLMWDEDLNFAISCNDTFYWGTADAEDITQDTFQELEQAIKDAGKKDGLVLYCARQRKMRPQGALYKHIDKDHWSLFNACGPERKTGIGNPHNPGEN